MTRTEKSRPLPLATYKNGNYTVRLYTDGTKIKSTPDDDFAAAFPDSIDLKITDYCDMRCPMCHENSSPEKGHGDVGVPFLQTLHRGTELAIGGGNPLSHPKLAQLLQSMKERGVICNLTVNEAHFLQSKERLQDMLRNKLIWGLGISVRQCARETLAFAAKNPTVILHVICGIIDEQTVQKMSGQNLKLLFLGYKKRGRGVDCYSAQVEEKIAWLKKNIRTYAPQFDTMCFDNLALEQLGMREQISQDLFQERYMGDDGSGSMYVDLVQKEFAVSSVSDARYPLRDSIDDMFAYLQTAK